MGGFRYRILLGGFGVGVMACPARGGADLGRGHRFRGRHFAGYRLWQAGNARSLTGFDKTMDSSCIC